MVPLTAGRRPGFATNCSGCGLEIRRPARGTPSGLIPRTRGAAGAPPRHRAGALRRVERGDRRREASVTSSGAPRRVNTEQRAHTSRRPQSVPGRVAPAPVHRGGDARAGREARELEARAMRRAAGRTAGRPAPGCPARGSPSRCRAHARPAAPSARRPPARRRPAGSPRARARRRPRGSPGARPRRAAAAPGPGAARAP